MKLFEETGSVKMPGVLMFAHNIISPFMSPQVFFTSYHIHLQKLVLV